MTTAKAKTMSKADWQKVAKKFKIEFTSKNTVRYLVEKIAELNGVDDKIVSLDELKKEVVNKLYSTTETKVKSKTKSKTKTVTAPKVEPKVEVDPEQYAKEEKQHYQNECNRLGVQYGTDQLASDLKQILDYHCRQNSDAGKYVEFGNDKKEVSKEVSVSPTLESLKKECEQVGLAYGSAHTVADLTNLLSAFKNAVGSAGLPPIQENTPNVHSSNAPELITDPSYTIINPTKVDMAQLDIYSDSILSTISNHFRMLSISEVHEMLNGGEYPFRYEIENSPLGENQIAITLISGDNIKRVPAQNWINING
tara:strand:- start:29 stop:958 length:930 start_codon:yes stop_codon:yes gene_type:complete